MREFLSNHDVKAADVIQRVHWAICCCVPLASTCSKPNDPSKRLWTFQPNLVTTLLSVGVFAFSANVMTYSLIKQDQSLLTFFNDLLRNAFFHSFMVFSSAALVSTLPSIFLDAVVSIVSAICSRKNQFQNVDYDEREVRKKSSIGQKLCFSVRLLFSGALTVGTFVLAYFLFSEYYAFRPTVKNEEEALFFDITHLFFISVAFAVNASSLSARIADLFNVLDFSDVFNRLAIKIDKKINPDEQRDRRVSASETAIENMHANQTSSPRLLCCGKKNNPEAQPLLEISPNFPY